MGDGSEAHDAILRRYRLVEIDREGRVSSEDFSAPNDDEALERAIEVGRGPMIELWCGARLIRRWSALGPPAAQGPQ